VVDVRDLEAQDLVNRHVVVDLLVSQVDEAGFVGRCGGEEAYEGEGFVGLCVGLEGTAAH